MDSCVEAILKPNIVLSYYKSYLNVRDESICSQIHHLFQVTALHWWQVNGHLHVHCLKIWVTEPHWW